MSAAKGKSFPNLSLARPDGTHLEIFDLRKKEHALVLLLPQADNDSLAFIARFQGEARLFQWLNLRLLPVYPKRDLVPTPWPAPAYPAALFSDPLPLGLGWGKAYVISKNGTLIEVYDEPDMLSVANLEKDMLYWEAGHCLA